MNPRVVLDENVSLQVKSRLERHGYEVIAVVKRRDRGMRDERVFEIVAEAPSLLVTCDAHFTNPFRFPSDRTEEILYITRGNHLGSEEADIVERFLTGHALEEYRGRLVFLSLGDPRIR